MTIIELENRLEESIQTFQIDIQSQYQEMSDTPATHSDINELARHTTYALSDFKKAIIDYLKSK